MQQFQERNAMNKIRFEDLEKYFEHIPGLMMIDMEGKIFYMNQQCADYFKIGKDDWLGEYVADVLIQFP